MHGRDNDGRAMKIDWSDNKEVAVKKKYGANAPLTPRGGGGGGGGGEKKKTPKGGKSGKGGKGIPQHEGKSIKFE